jgi:hypothetical protein
VGRDGGEYRRESNSVKRKYFFDWDWTGQITLIWLKKLISARNGFFDDLAAGTAAAATAAVTDPGVNQIYPTWDQRISFLPLVSM